MANTTAAIMAIPAPLEQIRLVGDEDKHATLLFFGETSTLPLEAKQTLMDSVELASGMLFPFSERVVDVSRLGDDIPPALVAMLSSENLGPVRNLFMMNPSVKSYLDNTQQFPSFTAHMTLGHPDFKDEVVLRALARNLYRIRFDRLAVWWNDERFEFDLSPVEGDSMSMSEAVDKILAHHGVKGQKWGVRRAVNSATGLVKRGRTSTPGEPGLISRTGSADQITQDRIEKKLKTGGVQSLSNADIQSYTRRLQMQDDLSRALAKQSAETQKKADGFIKSFVKSQGSRQFDRVANKAVDIAIEKAIESTGVKISKKSPGLGKDLGELSKRLKPKKK